MEYLLGNIYPNFVLFLLIFIRITGIFIMSPIFGRRNMPSYVKIGFSLIITYIFFGFQFQSTVIEQGNIFLLLYYIVKEILVGLIIGYITSLLFSAILLAGQLIDMQIGFGIVNVLDPQNNIQVPLVGNFNHILALLLFFLVDGHHTLLELLFYSFRIIPPGEVWLDPNMSNEIVRIFIKWFILAFKIALPVIATAFLMEMGLGILMRAVPQINIFVIGIPLKIIIGLIALSLFIPIYVSVLKGSFNDMFGDIRKIIQGMAL